MNTQSSRLARGLLAGILTFQALTALAAPAAEEEPVQELGVVTVKSSTPTLFPYRKAWRAFEVFEQHHQLAPWAPLRFMLALRDRQVDGVSGNALALNLVSDKASTPVLLDAERRFTLPRDQQAWDDNADLVVNRKPGLYIGLPDIRTPGVPADARRLGDLRLQCEIAWAIVKDDVGILQRTALTVLGGPCHTSMARIGVRAPKRLSGVTLVAGERRESLDARRILADGRFFAAPYHDGSWPDDTLVEFQYVAE